MMMSVKVIHSVKFPPFSSTNFEASAVPISNIEDVYDSLETMPSNMQGFIIGSKDGWFVEREVIHDGMPIKTLQAEFKSNDIKFDPIVKTQRRGWYIRPHPIHQKTRNLVNISVILLLSSLVYLFISPALSSIGIPTFGTSNIRIGLLDYPILALFVVPIVSIPFALKIGANIGDLRRQQLFLENPPKKPIIEIMNQPVSDDDLKVKVNFPEFRDDWGDVTIFWRAGALPPERSAVFEANGRSPDGQPPPGMTTEIPNKWSHAFDDGTAGGEDAPMEIADVKGGMFLRPMRIMETGGSSVWRDSDDVVVLNKLVNKWPGTIFTPLVKIHWEVILSIDREKGGPLLFVYPLIVHPSKDQIEIIDVKVNDGRAEFDSDVQT